MNQFKKENIEQKKSYFLSEEELNLFRNFCLSIANSLHKIELENT